jgi:dinuclear metal center YbgI/SA1388 family protein
MPSIAEVTASLESFARLTLAAEWDNVGLLVGTASHSVQRVMTCLSVTPVSAEEAIERSAQLIISHHPVLFRATKRLTADTTEGRVLLDLIRAGIAVYSPHTAFDNCPGGINDSLADQLGLVEVAPLRQRSVLSRQDKIVVFVPEDDVVAVSEAAFAAGAGIIGKYDRCSFRQAGTGTFRGAADSNPTIGSPGVSEEVAEWRLELVCPKAKLAAVLAAVRGAHSYETPAIDIYPLEAEPGPGEGRIGKLAKPCTLGELATRAKQRLGAAMVGMVGDASQTIGTLALACGAAGEFLADAVRLQADAFLTGEARFHECLEAQARGIGLLLPGHHATERPAVEQLANRVARQFPELEVWPSQRERDPVVWY